MESINTFAEISHETPVKFLRSSCCVSNIKHKLEVEIITLLIEIYRPILKPPFQLPEPVTTNRSKN